MGLVLLAIPLVPASCASTPPLKLDATPAEIYQAMSRDMDRRGGSAAVFKLTKERQDARYAEMAERVTREELTTAEEHFYAGAVLVRSSNIEHLLLAESSGRRAVILGDLRGRPVAAEAVDRIAMIEGKPQVFGTQYVYNYVTGNWQLYLFDDSTTDAERADVGLPPLAWFKDRVEQLNDSKKSERLRRELKLPPVRNPDE